MTGMPQGDSPLLLNCSYTITADIEVPEGGAEGMILTSGGRFGGYGFYLLKGKPVFLWNLVDLKRIRWEGPEALAPGKHTVEFDFKYDGLGAGTLAFNNMSGIGRQRHRHAQGGRQGGRHARRWSTRSRSSCNGTRPSTSAPTPARPWTTRTTSARSRFTGKLNKLTIKIDRPQLSPEDIKKLEAAAAEQQDERVAGPLKHRNTETPKH